MGPNASSADNAATDDEETKQRLLLALLIDSVPIVGQE
jgi:hypothetical protein